METMCLAVNLTEAPLPPRLAGPESLFTKCRWDEHKLLPRSEATEMHSPITDRSTVQAQGSHGFWSDGDEKLSFSEQRMGPWGYSYFAAIKNIKKSRKEKNGQGSM